MKTPTEKNDNFHIDGSPSEAFNERRADTSHLAELELGLQAALPRVKGGPTLNSGPTLQLTGLLGGMDLKTNNEVPPEQVEQLDKFNRNNDRPCVKLDLQSSQAPCVVSCGLLEELPDTVEYAPDQTAAQQTIVPVRQSAKPSPFHQPQTQEPPQAMPATLPLTQPVTEPPANEAAASTLGALSTTAPQPRPILTCRNIKKSFQTGKTDTQVLHGVNLEVLRGEFLSIIGRSGSGKSTLLHTVATLTQPDCGEITFNGTCINRLTARDRERYRNQKIGIVFQQYHLLPELNAIENVLVPLTVQYSCFSYLMRKRTLTQRAIEMLERVGLGHRLKHRPGELSGGEMQRVAIARALITEPTMLLADEPTGNLDEESGESVFQLLLKLQKELQLTILMVTHDPILAERSDRMVRIVEGAIEDRSALCEERMTA